MKNNIILTGLLFILIFATSCESEDYEAPYGDFSSFAWYTSAAGTEVDNSEYVIAINDTIIFSDVSQNEISHEWLKPDQTAFVKGVSTDNTVSIKFQQSGIKEVILKNIFKDSVNGGVLIDGNWEVEKIFTIDVFADIKPAFKVFKGDEEVLSVLANDEPLASNSNSWPTITLEAGEELTYQDFSTIGRSDSRTWQFNNASIDSTNAETVVIGYYGLGNTTAGSVTVKRKEKEVPEGETLKLIPLNINVIPSSQPFEQVGAIKEGETEVISLNVSGQIETLEGEEGNFIVHVVNTASGYDENISVASATINNDNLTQIDLVLDAPIFNSDEITVEFTGGNIVSIDSRVLSSFGPIKVKGYRNESVIGEAWAGFEVGATNWKSAFATGYWVGNSNDQASPFFSRSDVMFNSGVASMKFSSPDGIESKTLQGSFFTNGNKTPHGIPTLPAGTYEVSYMVYLEVGNTTQTFRTIIQGGDITFWDISALPRGEWVEISNTITTTSDTKGKRFDIKFEPSDNMGVTGAQIMYFDDLTWRPIELR